MHERDTVLIREATGADLEALVAVYTAAVHQIAARSYSAEQRHAWAPPSPDLRAWRVRLDTLNTLVACTGDEVARFLSYGPDGHIDLLFTAPKHARQGVAGLLFDTALTAFGSLGVTTITTDASMEARPFFERRGFRVRREEVVYRDGVALRRFRMEYDGSAAR